MTLLDGYLDVPDIAVPRNWWSRLWYRACPLCGDRFVNDGWQVIPYVRHWRAVHGSGWDGGL